MRELPLSSLAPAKINLGLFIGPLRDDGKHDLVSVMQSISLTDELTLELTGAQAGADQVRCPGVEGQNLAAGALEAFREATGWQALPLRLRIEKRIPVAAGLAGGSTDAAAALRLASAASGLGDERLLYELAAKLGADVPAALNPGRWLSGGAGERLCQLPDPDLDFGVLVLPADGELSTAAVYRQADLMGIARTSEDLSDRHSELQAALSGGAALPVSELLCNDLQAAAIELYPEIERRLQLACVAGAQVSFLSGSGPTVIGLFLGADGPAAARRAAAELALNAPAPIACVPLRRGSVSMLSTGASQLGDP